MAKLLVRQVSNSSPARFQVVRAADGKAAPEAVIAGPDGFPVESSPQSDLRRELKWYLEEFLSYPYPPLTGRADAAKKALQEWGKQAYLALFNNLDGGGFLQEAAGSDLRQLQLEIVSDDPGVLAWPWEALYDPKRQSLAHLCRIVRRLDSVADPPGLPTELPKDHISILLVTARPFERDVNYRSISRPLVELVAKEKLPARITVLRPPTLDALRRHLDDHPGMYHIIHFDGHGAYVEQEQAGDTFGGAEGQLAFENEEGKPELVPANRLSLLLAEHRIPAVVLNACQSGMVDSKAENAFASVAAALLRAGVRSVVAMAYSVYVSAAQEFLPEFYRRLFKSGSFAEATRAGRQQLLASQGRISPRGRFNLDDWVVPVVYEQHPLDLSFAQKASACAAIEMPTDVQDAANPYGFIGRDGELLQLERALYAAPAGVLIQGIGGVGKTTLAMGFARWLIETGGLEANRVVWFRFDDSLRSAEYIVNRLGEKLFGTQFVTAGIDERLAALSQAFREKQFLIIWDNFEVACGIAGTAVQPTLTLSDQQLLKRLLQGLRGGKTKVLITSRSEEDWLGPSNRRKITLSGLTGEERWEYCDVIINDLDRKPDRDDPALENLLDQLGGHPLAMRVILSQLEDRTPAQAMAQLAENIASFADGDDAERQLFGALRFVEKGLPSDVRELLAPLALHERFVDADYLEEMAKIVDATWTRDQIDRFVAALCPAGLLRDVGQNIYEMHPLLSRYLDKRIARNDVWSRAFVDIFGYVADSTAPKPLHNQRRTFFLHGVNFYRALHEALRLEMARHVSAITQSLAAYAINVRNFDVARQLYASLAEHSRDCGNEESAAGAYHQLGTIAQTRRQFGQAEQWYKKSLEIAERLGNEHVMASTYHQLGLIAVERRQFDQAVQWCKKSLEISERLGNEHVMASTYHQLGSIAGERRQFDQAEQWYKKSLEIKVRLGDEHGAASTYHQLGLIAQQRRQFDQAEQWYKKSLVIKVRLGDEDGAASTYHQLGYIAEERRQFDQAEQWYKKSLEISERLGNEHVMASTYHQLGSIAGERRQIDQAEQWHRKSLEIKERLGNEHGAAITYNQLGVVAQERCQFDQAEQWYKKSLEIKERLGDEHGAAITCGQLGSLSIARDMPDEAMNWMIRAGKLFMKVNDPHNLILAMTYFVRFCHGKRGEAIDRARAVYRWAEAGLSAIPEELFQAVESEGQAD